MNNRDINWHCLSIEENLKSLNSSINGLTSKEATQRFLNIGPNEIKRLKKKTSLEMLIDQFKDFMILVLIAAAIISGIVGEAKDTIAILVIVLVNAIIGFIQEYRAEKAVEALRKMATPNATVKRDGHIHLIPTPELVPGDIVILEAGNVVPADLRIFEVAQLKIEEAALTGESVSVDKHTEIIGEESIPLGDRKNMAYKGTTISNGRAIGIAVATGMKTELGKIATMLHRSSQGSAGLESLRTTTAGRP